MAGALYRAHCCAGLERSCTDNGRSPASGPPTVLSLVHMLVIECRCTWVRNLSTIKRSRMSPSWWRTRSFLPTALPYWPAQTSSGRCSRLLTLSSCLCLSWALGAQQRTGAIHGAFISSTDVAVVTFLCPFALWDIRQSMFALPLFSIAEHSLCGTLQFHMLDLCFVCSNHRQPS